MVVCFAFHIEKESTVYFIQAFCCGVFIVKIGSNATLFSSPLSRTRVLFGRDTSVFKTWDEVILAFSSQDIFGSFLVLYLLNNLTYYLVALFSGGFSAKECLLCMWGKGSAAMVTNKRSGV